ncbi:hypothetical protein [Streptomyces sp. NPDC059943]|uniref:hypothetical protein n=1 Tax=Streptomyces sp. NPDC059943 TaxID=3347010 RepID=UPI00365605EE
MSHRHRARLVVLSAVAAGAMLLPVSAAVASERASTQPASVADESPKDKAAAEEKAEAAKKGADAKAEAAKKAAAADQAPRGGVAAGEAPAEDTGTAPLVGSAIGVLLLAGAGTYVLRRRSAEGHTA